MTQFMFFFYDEGLEVLRKQINAVSETVSGTKLAPPYACIFMDYIDREFFKGERIQPCIWFRYIDYIFFI